jgi:hypothetical protein
MFAVRVNNSRIVMFKPVIYLSKLIASHFDTNRFFSEVSRSYALFGLVLVNSAEQLEPSSICLVQFRSQTEIRI